MGKIIKQVGDWPLTENREVGFWVWTIFYQIIYVLAIIFVLCTPALYQWAIIGWVTYLGFAAFLGLLRTHVRVKYGIGHGDMLTDFLCACFFPFFTLAQMEKHIDEEQPDTEVKQRV